MEIPALRRRKSSTLAAVLVAALAALCAPYLVSAETKVAAEQSKLECLFIKQEGFEEHPECATDQGGGRFTIASRLVQNLEFRDSGLAHVLIRERGWVYVKPDGFGRLVMAYDNGPDYFEDGLARAIVNGKLGYLNSDLEIVIAALYDGAYPFQNGHARVCIGCSIEQHGEHSSYTGGTWLCIDLAGRKAADSKCER